jgi:hypothetical protein
LASPSGPPRAHRSHRAPSDGLGEQRGDELIEAHAFGCGEAAQFFVQGLWDALAPLAERARPRNLTPQLARGVLPLFDCGERVLERFGARFPVASSDSASTTIA